MSDTVVSLRAVTVAYDGRAAVDAVNLEVRRGERVAVVGPSGAGKTTLLRLCTGSARPRAGDVRVLGVDTVTASGRQLRALRARIGTVHQQLHLVGPLLVVHNVNAGKLGRWSAGRALRSLIKPLEVADARRALDEVGIADKLFERTDRLSGGEQQRVALARALVQRPELLLADEPVSSLDPGRAEEVMGLLGAVASASRTLLMSLHDLELARRWCTRVVGLRHGKVLFDVEPAEVSSDLIAGLYRTGA